MEWLNYHHLLYSWVVAREGSVTRAAAELRLGQPTVSAQIRTLETTLGEKLFIRVGRNLALTDAGRVAFRFADEIFSLGRELLDTLKDRPTGRPLRFAVGIADVVPKLIAYRLLQPAFEQWFDAEGIRPLVTGEFEDSALLNVFGRAGLGIFPAPSAIEKETRQQYAVEPIGRVDAVPARFYAISVERRVKHPAVLAI